MKANIVVALPIIVPLVIRLIRFALPKLAPKVVPWLAAGMGAVATVALQHGQGVDVMHSVAAGGTAGAAGVGVYEAVLKYFPQMKPKKQVIEAKAG